MRDKLGRFVKGYLPEYIPPKGTMVGHKFKKGEKGYWKGKKFSKKHCKNITNALTGLVKEKARNWKGGQVIQNGYVYLFKPNHPFFHKSRYVPRNRIIMELHLNRPLNKKEIIHHINSNRSDDRIENLMLFPNNKEHTKFHILHNKKNNIHWGRPKK